MNDLRTNESTLLINRPLKHCIQNTISNIVPAVITN